MRSYFLSLPPEMILNIATRLQVKDLRSLSCISSLVRQVVVTTLFCSIRIQPERFLNDAAGACNELDDFEDAIKHMIK